MKFSYAVAAILIPCAVCATSYDSGGGGPVTSNNLSANAAGTAYSLTNSAAAIVFGTTSPSITITAAGTYLIMGAVNLKYNAATMVANRTVTLTFRRTNNTAGNVGTARTATTRVITTITDDMGVFSLSPLVYTTVNSNDIITIFGSMDTVPSAGSVDIFEAEIYAIRIQ